MRYATMFGRGLMAVVGVVALGGSPALAQHPYQHPHPGTHPGFPHPQPHPGVHPGFPHPQGGMVPPGGDTRLFGFPNGTVQQELGQIEGVIGGMTGFIPDASNISGAEAKGYIQGLQFDQSAGVTGVLQPPAMPYPQPMPYYPQTQPFYPQTMPFSPPPAYQPAAPPMFWNGYPGVQVP